MDLFLFLLSCVICRYLCYLFCFIFTIFSLIIVSICNYVIHYFNHVYLHEVVAYSTVQVMCHFILILIKLYKKSIFITFIICTLCLFFENIVRDFCHLFNSPIHLLHTHVITIVIHHGMKIHHGTHIFKELFHCVSN